MSSGYSGTLSLYPQIVSAALAGNVIGICPLGFARPRSNRAVDVPPSSPENHISRTDLTLLIQGIRTGFVVLSTTTVFGFAAATALMRLVLALESDAGAEIQGGLPPGWKFAYSRRSR